MMNRNESFDTVVVGAGPAGLLFSRLVASKGYRVVVIEKERKLGMKPCGEAVSARALETSMISKERRGDFVSREIKRAYVYAPNGGCVEVEEKGALGYTLEKHIFLRVLASEASSEGVSIRMLHQAKEVERVDDGFEVRGKNFKIKTSLLIGADGYFSIVAKRTGLETPGERTLIPCIQYEMTGCKLQDIEGVEFFIGNKIAPLGYAWVFPKGEKEANVGIGVRGHPAKEYLDRFVARNQGIFGSAQIIGVNGAPVTISGLLSRVVDDNLMLIGEAAGQVIPFTGGGIHASIAGAIDAAETACEALEDEDFSRNNLGRYVERYSSDWGDRISKSLRALKVIENLDDEALNQLAEVVDGEDILDLANGLNIIKVAKKLIRHPGLGVKIARALKA